MSRNFIQLQKGYSLLQFEKDFPDEEACRRRVERDKWPQGFRCRFCEGTAAWRFSRGPTALPHWQCQTCGQMESLIAGTLFEHTRLPLRTWFLACALLSQAKTQISALELRRQLGVNDKTALLLKHKIMAAAAAAEEGRVLGCRVELDDAYLGGVRHGGSSGRGAAGKIPILVAVETDADLRPRHAVFSAVAAFTREVLKTWGKEHLVESTLVLTDGLDCFKALENCEHEPHNMSVEGKTVADTDFKWVNTVLGNIKTAFRGVLHAFDHFHYGGRYLGFIQFLFNHRFDLVACFGELISLGSSSPPRSARMLRGEAA
jgi:hypothetical protein